MTRQWAACGLAAALLVLGSCAFGDPEARHAGPSAGATIVVDPASIPLLQPGTQHENAGLRYTLLGWEASARRFWVVTSRSAVDDRATRDAVLLEIHARFGSALNLDASRWNVSFFDSATNAHYKPFPAGAYLAEYFSCRAPEPESNRINIRPETGRWRRGPAALSCGSS